MDDITRQITEAMKQYTGAVSEEIETALKSVGKEAAVKLKQTSPKRSGKYRRGWICKVSRESGKISVVVHNREYRLTHLLEHGHKARDGSRAKAISHIDPVEKWAVSEAMKAIEKAVKG